MDKGRATQSVRVRWYISSRSVALLLLLLHYPLMLLSGFFLFFFFFFVLYPFLSHHGARNIFFFLWRLFIDASSSNKTFLYWFHDFRRNCKALPLKKNREETVQHVNNISGCVRKEVGQPILYGKTLFFLLLLAKEGFFFSLPELQIVCVETQVFLFLEPFRNDCQ